MTRDDLLEQQRTDLCALVTELNKAGEFRSAVLVMAVVEANVQVAEMLAERGIETEKFLLRTC